MPATSGEFVAIVFATTSAIDRYQAAFFRQMPKRRMTGRLNILPDLLRKKRFSAFSALERFQFLCT